MIKRKQRGAYRRKIEGKGRKARKVSEASRN
jgi:hypothetical protein